MKESPRGGNPEESSCCSGVAGFVDPGPLSDPTGCGK